MIHLIATHWLAAMGVVVLLAALFALFVYGLCAAAGAHDEPRLIEPQDLMENAECRMQKEDETVCAWCQREQAVKAQPHESHGICGRHLAEMRQEVARLTRTA